MNFQACGLCKWFSEGFGEIRLQDGSVTSFGTCEMSPEFGYTLPENDCEEWELAVDTDENW